MGFWSTLGTVAGDIGGTFIGDPNLGSQIIGGLNSANAIGNAAKQMTGAATASNNLLTGAQQNAFSSIGEGLNQSYSSLSPYLQGGANAAVQLSDLMNPGNPNSPLQGFQGQLNTPQFTPPNPQDVLNNPSIQFQLQQGEKAIQNSASAKGILNSGATLKSLNNYAQGVASTGYNDLFNQAQQTWQNQYQKALQDFGTAYNVFQDTRNTKLGLLNTMLQSGQGAASQFSNQALSTGNQYANTYLGVAGQQGANLQGAANVNAAATLGKAGAMNGVYGAIGNAATGLYGLYKNSQQQPSPWSQPVGMPSYSNPFPTSGGITPDFGSLQ